MVSRNNYSNYYETCRTVDQQTIISWCIRRKLATGSRCESIWGEGERRLHRGEFIFARFKGGRRRIREESSPKWLSSSDDGRSSQSRHSADVRERQAPSPSCE
ncbi:hypothetical protein CEXT_815601 [Caerostris extrusa]|uniref:Uncharacterized protein n=1 Tax=Caerostris extrusa TaxID=172846 RepID=A0AAV4S5N6_CAEEX|nr:hypothetical protein CEXT_815601 [Caerostris extrusa]